MAERNYTVKLDNVFEGPMDLLVYLIRKNEVDIYDIPIALITDQFLEYIDFLKALNIDLAGDFILMASTLAQIKSKMLIPIYDSSEEAEDPRTEIIRPLLEYLQMKSAAEFLARRDHLGEDTFTRKVLDDEVFSDTESPVIQVGLFELIDAFKKILQNIPEEKKLDFSDDKISVKDRIAELVDLLEEKQSVTFSELFAQDSGKNEIILTFLALLEMVKMNLVSIFQTVQSGMIRIIYI